MLHRSEHANSLYKAGRELAISPRNAARQVRSLGFSPLAELGVHGGHCCAGFGGPHPGEGDGHDCGLHNALLGGTPAEASARTVAPGLRRRATARVQHPGWQNLVQLQHQGWLGIDSRAAPLLLTVHILLPKVGWQVFCLEPAEAIENVRAQIQTRLGMDNLARAGILALHLVYKGVRMDDGTTLSDYNIRMQDGITLFDVLLIAPPTPRQRHN